MTERPGVDRQGRLTHCEEPMVGVQYEYTHPEHYDGVSEWCCSTCGARFGRWTGKELKGEEVERRYGRTK